MSNTTITSSRLKELEDCEAKLHALETGWVDNWAFYDVAMNSYREKKAKDEKLDRVLIDLELAFLDGCFEPAWHWAWFSATNEARDYARDILKKFLTQ